jgi:hypothetical protein
MIKSGDADLSASSSNRVRYDLKQVAQWDKQIKADQQKKLKAKSGKSSAEKKEKDQESDNVTAYRDRAKERRKEEQNQTTQQEQHSQEKLDLTSGLTVEQTKFLGGDMEHTHLVKGLDFALLARIREETKANIEILEGDKDEKEEIITTKTKLGFNVKRYMDAHRSSILNIPIKSASKSKIKSENTLCRTVYQYDIAPSTFQEIPLTVCRSKQESIFREEYVHFLLKAEIIQLISDLFDAETHKMIPRAKRKHESVAVKIAKDLNETPKHETLMSKLDVNNIYGDDLLTQSAVQTSAPTAGKKRTFPLNTIVIFDGEEGYSAAPTENIRVKGLFDGSGVVVDFVKSHAKSDLKKTAPSSSEVFIQSNRKLHEDSQSAKFPSSKAPSDVFVADKTAKDKVQKINRDVFATTVDNVVNVEEDMDKKKGDIFGISGIYDVFPETGDYEVKKSISSID